MDQILEFVRYVWVGLTAALRLDPRVFEIVEAYPQSRWAVLVIALIGGAGLMVGQAVILIVNRISPARFLLSLGLNAVLFALSLALWAVSIWLIGRFVLPSPESLGATLRLVALGAAPYIFGPLILMPYAGAAFGKLLAVWSALVVVSAVTTMADGSTGPALITVATGWLIIEVAKGALGRPIIAVHDWLWQHVAGSALDVRVDDILTGQVNRAGISERGRKGSS